MVAARQRCARLWLCAALTGCFSDPTDVAETTADTSGTSGSGTDAGTDAGTTAGPSSQGPVSSGDPTPGTSADTDVLPCETEPAALAVLPADIVVAVTGILSTDVGTSLAEVFPDWDHSPSGNRLAVIDGVAHPAMGGPTCVADGCTDPTCGPPVQYLAFVGAGTTNGHPELVVRADRVDCIFRPSAPEGPAEATRHIALFTSEAGAAPVDPAFLQLLGDNNAFLHVACPACGPTGAGALVELAHFVSNVNEVEQIENAIRNAGAPRAACGWPANVLGGYTSDDLQVRVAGTAFGDGDVVLERVPGPNACGDGLAWFLDENDFVVLCPLACGAVQFFPIDMVVVDHLWGTC